MISRRKFVGAAVITHSIPRAHAEDGFVLPEAFRPREETVREQCVPDQILVFPSRAGSTSNTSLRSSGPVARAMSTAEKMARVRP
mgnify:CR=1 FL=1